MAQKKPTTPSQRHTNSQNFSSLTTNKPLKSLVKGTSSSAGRSKGRISVRHRGGGHKRKLRNIDFKQIDKLDIPAKVANIEYDPGRTAFIAQLNYADGEKRYLLASEGLKKGDTVLCAEKAPIKPGNRLMLKNIPAGTIVHNIELYPNRGGIMARSAGSGVKLMNAEGEYAQLQLPSKEIRLVKATCFASIGQVSNSNWTNVKLGKAGRKRWLGKRPQVRGSAMNPVDHPHGGGEGRSPIGLKHPKTPWGKIAYGVKTRRPKKPSSRFVVKRRPTKR